MTWNSAGGQHERDRASITLALDAIFSRIASCKAVGIEWLLRPEEGDGFLLSHSLVVLLTVQSLLIELFNGTLWARYSY